MSDTTPEVVQGAPEDIQDRIMSNGGTYFVLESTWWGNNKFGTWAERFTGQVEAETDDALLLEDVRTVGGKRVGSGWIPKSKIDKRVDAPEPENHVIFNGEENNATVGKASEADYSISETDYYRGRYKDYLKYVVDFSYDEELKENFKRDDDDDWWERFHPSAKYENDDFKHWWIDGDIDLQVFARELSDGEYTVAVHREFLQ